MVLFKDISKTASDFLHKDFPHEKICEVEHRYVGDKPQITSNVSISRDSSADASTTVKHKIGNVFTEVKLQKSGNTTCEVKYADPAMKGFTLGGKYDQSRGKTARNSFEASSEFEAENFHGKLQFNPFESSYTGSVCAKYMGHGNLLFGGEFNVTRELSSLKYTLGGSYTKKNSASRCSIALHTSFYDVSRIGKVVAYLHGHTGNAPYQPSDYAAELQHNINDRSTSILFGGKWYLNGNPDTYLKAKLSHDAKVGLALTHKFSKSLSATLGAQYDGLKASNADNVKYGLKLNLSS